MALDLLEKEAPPQEVVSSLVARFELSPRQAYRYLEQARETSRPLLVPEPKAAFTVKLPLSLLERVKSQARREGRSISDWVAGSLGHCLEKPSLDG